MATPRKDWKKEWEAVQKESRKLAKRANQRLVRLEHYAERDGLSEILKYAYEKAATYINKQLGVSKSGLPRFKEHVKLYDIESDMGYIAAEEISIPSKELDKVLDKESRAVAEKRISELYKQNVQIQRHRIKEMKEFLESESSVLGTKKYGINRIYDKRTKTINEQFLKEYGLKMTDNDVKRFFDSKKQAKLAEVVGSDLMFAVASVMKKHNLKSNKRDLEKFMKSHIDLSKTDLSIEDIKARKGESYKDYLDRLQKFAKYTDDEVLNEKINQALKKGINVDNIFI